jgi:hypothetical protein
MLKTTFLFLLFACPDVTSLGYELARPGATVDQTAPSSIYQYDNFREGIVTFRNGSRQRARLNYNRMLAKLMFIDERNDTLLLTNKLLIRYVLIDNRQYLPGQRDEDNDLEVLASYPDMKLARTTKAVVGGNGDNASTQQFKSDSTSTVPNALLLVNQGPDFQWQNNASAHVARQKSLLYIIDTNERVYRASYRNLTRLLRGKKAAIDRYLNENTVNFDDPQQLKALVESVTDR